MGEFNDMKGIGSIEQLRAAQVRRALALEKHREEAKRAARTEEDRERRNSPIVPYWSPIADAVATVKRAEKGLLGRLRDLFHW